MTSETEKEAFVWIWLPSETETVVAGRLEEAELNEVDRQLLWRRQFIPPYSLAQ
jgi:hypothetical protein